MPFRFNTLLQEAGIDPAEVRLLRHQPKVGGRFVQDAWQADSAEVEAYQAIQWTARRAYFTGSHWAVFTGTEDGRTLFLGLYEVGEPVTVPEALKMPLSVEACEAGTVDRYPLRRMEAFDRWSGRLYVDWGGGSSGRRAWVQRAGAQDKLVTELYGEVQERSFPGLMMLSEPLSVLKSAPPGWRRHLEAKGVYLLTCPRDGSQYVGSATGDGGFWGRWSSYMAGGHGGNVALIGREPSDFTVSVLQAAGSGDDAEAIYAMEDRWKRKLGARAFGLCRN